MSVRTRRRRYVAVAGALGLALTLAACGDDDGDGGGGSTAEGCEAYSSYGTFDGETKKSSVPVVRRKRRASDLAARP